jgi:multiple sugar transport system permease protein
VTIPLVWPYIMVAIILRAIDALKTFDIIYVMTQGGPGTASETLNIFLYLQAFAFFNIGFASAVVVVYFLILMVMSVGLMITRQKTSWQ